MTRRAALGSSEAIGSSAISTWRPAPACARWRRAAAGRRTAREPASARARQCRPRSRAFMARCRSTVVKRARLPRQGAICPSRPRQHVGQHRQPRHQIELLEDHADVGAQPGCRARDAPVLLHRLAQDADAAGGAVAFASAQPVDRDEAGDGPDQGGLAGPGGADQGHHLAAGNREADVSQHGASGLEGLGDPGDLNGCGQCTIPLAPTALLAPGHDIEATPL